MPLLNTYIAASAGAGKTYQLVSRYLTLLVLQYLHQGRVDASQIIAITFTRKAAAEFKARILADLADAAQSEAAATRCWEMRVAPILDEMQLAQDVEPPLAPLFTDILAEIMEQFSQLNLGTIDSLFQRIARTLCTELGLARLTPLDPLEETSKRRHALDLTYENILLQPPSEDDALLQEAIVESLDHLSDLSYADSKIFQRVSDYHEIMLSSPYALWGGDPDRLSEEQLALFGLSPDDVRVSENETTWRERVQALIELFIADEAKTLFPEPVKEKTGIYIFAQRAGSVEMHHATARVYRDKFLRYLRSMSALQGSLEPVEVKGMEDASALEQAAARYAPYWDICREQGYDIAEMLRARRAYVWRGLLRRTQALHRLLSQVETQYQSEVREQGLYSFSDVARLLQGQMNEQSYALVQERLDAQLQHWLLDEFQDTSHEQYAILRDLLLARAQEGDEGSVFMVGDAKQSIYAFRGGDPKIFLSARDELFGLDAPDQSRSQEKPLNCSYRSSQDVLNLVNELFGEQFRRYAPLAAESTHQLWEQLRFAPHRSSRSAEDFPGCTQIWRMERQVEELEGKEVAYHFIADLLGRTRPAAALTDGSPLPSCALLVSTTAEGLRLHEALTALQAQYNFVGPVVYSGDRAVGSDAPLGLALMQLFYWLQNPADKQSRDLLELTPLWRIAQDIGGYAPWQTLRELIAQGGISELLRELTRGERKNLINNSQLLTSWKIWVAEAARFDEQGGTLQEWIERVEQLRLRDESQGDAIRIMTIHKSKGLEFDMVVLPLLATRDALATYGKKKILQHRGEHGETYAALLRPSDEGWAREQEGLYQLMIEPWRAQEEFASLCALYVALTRAKRATYIVLPPATSTTPKQEGLRHIMGQFIKHAPAVEEVVSEPDESQLATCAYHAGHAFWFEELESPADDTSDSLAEQAVPEQLAARYDFRTLPRRTPSNLDDEAGISGFANLPPANAGAHAGIQLGNAIHALMQQIDWLPYPEIQDLSTLLALLPRALQQDIGTLEILHRALCSAAWQPHFTRPQRAHRLYREQSIEALWRGSWVSGQIDRLLVFYDDAGKPSAATIYDFKTNADARELKAHYREQMRAYRHMVALAFQLPEAQVSVTLLHCPRQGEAQAWSYGEEDWR